MRGTAKLCVFGVFCLVLAVPASEARAGEFEVQPVNPVIAVAAPAAPRGGVRFLGSGRTGGSAR